MVFVQEELSDARMRCDEIHGMVSRALELVNKSNQKDHLYAVAGDLIYGLPQSLLALTRALEAMAMAVNKIDYEDLRQTLRPEKVDELERVLESVRLRIPRRTGSSTEPDEVVAGLPDSLHEDSVLAFSSAIDSIVSDVDGGYSSK